MELNYSYKEHKPVVFMSAYERPLYYYPKKWLFWDNSWLGGIVWKNCKMEFPYKFNIKLFSKN